MVPIPPRCSRRERVVPVARRHVLQKDVADKGKVSKEGGTMVAVETVSTGARVTAMRGRESNSSPLNLPCSCTQTY